jgi:hypothetical protein
MESREKQIYIDMGPELPHSYNESRFVAMVRDPNCVFLYWTLDGELSLETISAVNQDNCFIRTINLNHNQISDTKINIAARNHYMNAYPDNRYYFQLGFFNKSKDEFVVIIRSNEVKTPKIKPSEARLTKALSNYTIELLERFSLPKQYIPD